LPPGEGGRQAMPRSALDSKIRALKINKHLVKTGERLTSPPAENAGRNFSNC
jgi:hypothetical protein